MATEVYTTVGDCDSCTSIRGTHDKHQRHMALFPASLPLEFVALKIMGPLPKTYDCNQFLLVITDRYSKINRAILITNKMVPHMAGKFLDNWVMPYGIPTYMFTDNGPQFEGKCFA